MLATSDLYHGLGVLVDDPGPGTGRWELEQITIALQSDGEPGLLIGSGNGGWLLALRSQGLQVDGVDAALERIANCAQRAGAAGISVRLFWQPMQALDLPRRYRTIAIINGALMHVTDPDQALETLRRAYHHLQPGGRLLLSSLGWQPIVPSSAGRDWRLDESLSGMSGGAQLAVERRPVALDPVDLILTDERRYRLMHGTRLLFEEQRRGQMRLYGSTELVSMLLAAGFEQIREIEPAGKAHPADSRRQLLRAVRPNPSGLAEGELG